MARIIKKAAQYKVGQIVKWESTTKDDYFERVFNIQIMQQTEGKIIRVFQTKLHTVDNAGNLWEVLKSEVIFNTKNSNTTLASQFN